jgi:hypothetical protein
LLILISAPVATNMLKRLFIAFVTVCTPPKSGVILASIPLISSMKMMRMSGSGTTSRVLILSSLLQPYGGYGDIATQCVLVLRFGRFIAFISIFKTQLMLSGHLSTSFLFLLLRTGLSSGIASTFHLFPISAAEDRVVKWNCFNHSCYILNADGSCLGNPQRTGFWGLIRNNVGFFISGFSGHIDHSDDILFAELHAHSYGFAAGSKLEHC